MTDSVFALLVILVKVAEAWIAEGFAGSHWNLRSNWVLKKSDVMIWIWTNLRQRRNRGNKMDKSKFGISVGRGDRAMVKGQSLTTRAGDLIEFIFAKESMLRLVKWWKKSLRISRFNWALYLLTLDIPKIYYLTMKIWGGSVIEKNENRSAVNVGDSDEFAAAKMFQHQWWMDSDGQLTLGNFKWNDFQKNNIFPSFSEGMSFPIFFTSERRKHALKGVLQIRLRASQELKE